MASTTNNSTEQIKFTAEILFSKFQSIALTTAQVSTVIPRSIVSLRRDRHAKKGIPFSKFGDGIGKDLAMYNIYDIAKFMSDNQIKVVPIKA